jgi:hypothetical protein
VVAGYDQIPKALNICVYTGPINNTSYRDKFLSAVVQVWKATCNYIYIYNNLQTFLHKHLLILQFITGNVFSWYMFIKKGDFSSTLKMEVVGVSSVTLVPIY